MLILKHKDKLSFLSHVPSQTLHWSLYFVGKISFPLLLLPPHSLIVFLFSLIVSILASFFVWILNYYSDYLVYILCLLWFCLKKVCYFLLLSTLFFLQFIMTSIRTGGSQSFQSDELIDQNCTITVISLTYPSNLLISFHHYCYYYFLKIF